MSTRWLATGYGTSLAAFVVSALFFVDVFGEWLVNTSYIFPVAYWLEVTAALVACAFGVVLAAATYWRR
ncbi:MAG TPA: hypothetical protein VFV92_12495 [Candidatus Bathyarchaeia archaeon]|nr:hypothetical protein [Candidatus Bathyarchaeia archaeon]